MKLNILLPIICLSLISPNTFAKQYNSASDRMDSASDMSMSENVQTQNDPIQIILNDHGYITNQFDQIISGLDTDVKQSREKFKSLKDFLVKHETMEQKAWYPDLEKNKDLKSIIADLKKEEDNANKAIKKLDGIKDDAEWAKGIRQFKDDVMHHASDEQSNLFPKVREAMNKDELDKIGKKMIEFRKKNNMEPTQ